ncbi:MAG: DUF721 domain-containing protein [Schwartzia sp.]|nr:DUF721 domain-containing protein [Schwartzia sp. (in: firmicutes)]
MKKGKAAKEEAHTRKTERFSDVLPRFVSSFGQEKEYLTQLLFHHWKEIVGPSVSLHVRPVRMDFHKLFLAADAPVWANELRYMERKLIDKINAFVCEELVKEICFCTPQEETFAARHEKFSAETPETIETIPEDYEKTAEIISDIENETLRAAASRAVAQNMALQRTLSENQWHSCQSCGRLTAPEKKLCPACEQKKKEEEESAVRRLLLREPWLHGYEVSHIIGCSRETAFQARFSLLQTIASRIPKGDETSDDAKMLVMLYAAIKPEKLTGPIIAKYMERLRFDLLPDAFPSDGKRKKRSVSRRNE